MQLLLFLFVCLVLLALLFPPIALLATVLRRQKEVGWTTRSPILAAAAAASVVAVAFNTIFVTVRLGEIMTSAIERDAFLFMALTVSWFSFFGRMILKATLLRRRKPIRRRV